MFDYDPEKPYYVNMSGGRQRIFGTSEKDLRHENEGVEVDLKIRSGESSEPIYAQVDRGRESEIKKPEIQEPIYATISRKGKNKKKFPDLNTKVDKRK